MIVNAAIGKYDGDIYEITLTWSRPKPTIKTKAPYSAALEAMLNRPSLEAREI